MDPMNQKTSKNLISTLKIIKQQYKNLNFPIREAELRSSAIDQKSIKDLRSEPRV